MRNEKNGNAFAGQLMKRSEELSHGLRREHRRRFVQDEKLRVRHERANDFDALALAHRELHHDCSRIDFKAVALAELADLLGHICNAH